MKKYGLIDVGSGHINLYICGCLFAWLRAALAHQNLGRHPSYEQQSAWHSKSQKSYLGELARSSSGKSMLIRLTQNCARRYDSQVCPTIYMNRGQEQYPANDTMQHARLLHMHDAQFIGGGAKSLALMNVNLSHVNCMPACKKMCRS